MRPGVQVRVERGDLVRVQLAGKGAIVNPANSLGLMGGGVAGAIKRAGGGSIEDEARKRAPIALGSALLTTAGTLPFAGVIHAPTMLHPAEDADAELVREACEAAVKLAHAEGLESLAFPGMGTGTGGLDLDAAARAMLDGIREGLEEARSPPPRQVVLVAYDDALEQAFRAALGTRAREEGTAGATLRR